MPSPSLTEFPISAGAEWDENSEGIGSGTEKGEATAVVDAGLIFEDVVFSFKNKRNGLLSSALVLDENDWKVSCSKRKRNKSIHLSYSDKTNDNINEK